MGVDRDLGQAMKVSAVYTYRRERYQLGTRQYRRRRSRRR